MGFKKFSRSTARTDTGALWLSIQTNGAISVSYSALKQVGLPDAVHLLFDTDTHRIALQPAPEDSNDAYPTRLQGRGDNPKGARVVSANAFFRHIGLDPESASGRYDAEIDDDLIVAQLPKKHFVEDSSKLPF